MKQGRYKGKFCKKNVANWRENVAESNKSRYKPKEDSSYVLVGRRLIDISLLAEELWCRDCDKPLSFRHAISEIQNGVASTFNVVCSICSAIIPVNTSSLEPDSATKPTYTVNTKIVAGVIESGCESTHLNKILSAVGVPIMQTTTFKRSEKKVGKAIESLAAESCLENLRAEREMTIQMEG